MKPAASRATSEGVAVVHHVAAQRTPGDQAEGHERLDVALDEPGGGRQLRPGQADVGRTRAEQRRRRLVPPRLAGRPLGGPALERLGEGGAVRDRRAGALGVDLVDVRLRVGLVGLGRLDGARVEVGGGRRGRQPLLDDPEWEEVVALLGEDPPQPGDVVVVELAVARRRALRVEQALALQEPDLRDRDVREVVVEEGEDLPDRQVGAEAAFGLGSGVAHAVVHRPE